MALPRTRPSTKHRLLGVFAAAALFASVGAACADDAPDAPGSAGGAGGGGAAAAEVTYQPGDTIEFVASEFAFAPPEIVAEPGTYTGVLINDGTIEHDITFGDGEPVVAAAGESVEFEFTVPEEGVAYICSIAGHEDAGHDRHGPHAGLGGGSRARASRRQRDAATPRWRRRRSRSSPTRVGTAVRAARPDASRQRGEGEGVTLVPGGAPDGGDLIEVELVVEEKLMTVAEGYQQQVWTFGGTVPGPVLRTQVGDTVRVHLVNPPEASEVSHSIDFHASQVAWNDEMRSIAPGEDLIYEFTTDYAGVWMYHCGTDPVLHHIANGMFGMVIVEPEGGLPPIDHEFFLVQNEWYLGEQGEVSSLREGRPGHAGARLRDVQRRRPPVRRQPDRGPDRRGRAAVRARRRPVDRLVVPHRRHDLPRRHQGRRPPRCRQRGQLGHRRPSICRPLRAR